LLTGRTPGIGRGGKFVHARRNRLAARIGHRVRAGAGQSVISNGVLNLSTEKGQTFRELYRVLKPGGRLVFSDSVVNGQLPRAVLDSEAAFAG
jgi:SAM-dependent methyltransferase